MMFVLFVPSIPEILINTHFTSSKICSIVFDPSVQTGNSKNVVATSAFAMVRHNLNQHHNSATCSAS